MCENTTVKKLDLSSNKFGFKGADAISKLITSNHFINTIGLGWNQLHGLGAKCIIESIKVVAHIKAIHVYINTHSRHNCSSYYTLFPPLF